MPLKQMPTFNAIQEKVLDVPQPGIGGLNLFDLEYEQEVNQSPYMMNMMYRNGVFGKRYGQSIYQNYNDEIYALCYFNNHLIVHSGSSIYVDNEVALPGVIEGNGKFIKFGQSLLYFCCGEVYEYKYNKEWIWDVMVPYIPDIAVNCKPTKDSEYDLMDEFNLLSLKFKNIYDGNNTAGAYYMYPTDGYDIINWEIDPVVYVEDVKKVKDVDFEIATDNENLKYIKFKTGKYPPVGIQNVEIIYTMKESNLSEDRDRLLGSKYFISYGANGTSHLFCAGGGDSKLFYSDTYDASYFPENNWLLLGSTEEDITGFGLQYNVLIAFKPKEIYSLYTYTTTASLVTSENEEDIGKEALGCNLVNSQNGCDAPGSIQTINNSLVWLNSKYGVCILVSTNISDERNVRLISRNINNTNNMKINGILDLNDDVNSICSIDYDNKYFLVFPQSGYCYMWDYAIAPFTYTTSKITDPKTLDWFLFDNFHINQFEQVGKDLICFGSTYNNKLIKLDDSLSDFVIENNQEVKIPISAFYMTPLNQFNAVEYLKTIKNIYVQCRGDKATKINMMYITEENPNGDVESDTINIYSNIFDNFTWENFGWEVVNYLNTFKRKCSIKNVQSMAVKFWNNDVGNDMSISHLAFQYQVIKYIK